MKNAIVDNSGGPVGVTGIVIGKLAPSTPAEWLIFFSTILVLCQISHYGYRFFRYVDKIKKVGK